MKIFCTSRNGDDVHTAFEEGHGNRRKHFDSARSHSQSR